MKRVYKKLNKFYGKLLVVCIFISFIIAFAFTSTKNLHIANASSQQLIQTSQQDFQSGKNSNTIDFTSEPGSIKLNRSESITNNFQNTTTNANNTFNQSNNSISRNNGITLGLKHDYYLPSDPINIDFTNPDGTIAENLFDTSGNIIYIATRLPFSQQVLGNYSELNVIDTKGTLENSDDEFLGKYTRFTTASFTGIGVSKAELDSSSGLLYLSSYGWANSGDGLRGSLSIIDTKGTPSTTDDELVGRYLSSPSAPIPMRDGLNQTDVYDFYIEPENNFLIVTATEELIFINTQGTVSLTDDTVIVRIDFDMFPSFVALNGASLSQIIVDTSRNLVYVLADDIYAFNLPAVRTNSAG